MALTQFGSHWLTGRLPSFIVLSLGFLFCPMEIRTPCFTVLLGGFNETARYGVREE
jgi:hypothetical protein